LAIDSRQFLRVQKNASTFATIQQKKGAGVEHEYSLARTRGESMANPRELLEESSASSIKALETDVLALRRDIALRKEVQGVELFVRKLQKKGGGSGGGAGVSTLSSACTSACFSSASTICAKGVTTVLSQDPEMAQVFATLHRRGIDTLGEDGFMDAVLAEAKQAKAIDIVALAADRDK
jgi:hypothetical protein